MHLIVIVDELVEVDPPAEAAQRRVDYVGIAICSLGAMLSLSLGYYELLRPGVLHNILEYDDGVWFGSAVRMAHGAVPYRDFSLVQPPGVPVVLMPIALLSRAIGTRNGFALARLSVPVVQAISVFLCGWLLRHRSRAAAVVACTVFAVFPTAIITEDTVMLEPFCVLGCMAGLVAVFQGDRLTSSTRRLLIAGGFFGLAGSMKAFAVAPFAVVVAALLLTRERRDRRRAIPFVVGAGAVFTLVCGVFFLASPRNFVRDVISTQLSRSGSYMVSSWSRLLNLLGLPDKIGMSVHNQMMLSIEVAVACAVVILAGYGTTAFRRRPGGAVGAHSRVRDRDPAALVPLVTQLDATVFVMAIATALFLVQPSSFFYHYAAFFAPFLALVLGLGAGRLSPYVSPLLAVGALIVGTAHAVNFVDTKTGGLGAGSSLFEQTIPPGACVLTDDPAYLLLANRFTSSGTCSPMVDAYGTTLARDGGIPGDWAQLVGAPTVQYWYRQLQQAQYLHLQFGLTPHSIPWNDELVGYVKQHFVLVPQSPIYKRQPSG